MIFFFFLFFFNTLCPLQGTPRMYAKTSIQEAFLLTHLLIEPWTLTLSPLLSFSYPSSLETLPFQTLTKTRFLRGRKEAEDSMATKSEAERMEIGRSLTWCWHRARPVDERRATGDPGWTGWPGVGLNVGNDPQLCLDCEGKMPLTQSAQIWPRGLDKRKINEYFYELSGRYQLLNNVLGWNIE